ncbi:hypothetical protein QAD02_012154 [Eretmocerus hayati]|uniref:Uncharacterized protein n=1 Tax=Eretmocerus hayati TaxID=131215 RepID=A0ACC2NZ16_9HYME|nr:hypothetical protein QAD02_012154 [Eretmocerus hayati]
MSSAKLFGEIRQRLKKIRDVNSFICDGENILHQSVKRYNSVDVVKVLQSRGANLHITTEYCGKNVIHLAIESMKRSNYNSTQKLIKFLIDQKVDVNAQDYARNTALHYIIKNCTNVDQSISLINLLVQSGARVDTSNIKGQTALHLAVEMENFALSEHLICVGANVNHKEERSKSALHISVGKCNLPITKLLIQKGAKVDNIPSDQGSLLHIAIHSSKPGKLRMDLVKLLLESGTDINACDDSLSTPLHLVLTTKDEDCAKFLIRNNSSLDKQDKKGNTPLRIAVEKGLESSVKLLLIKGANPNDTKRREKYNFIDEKSLIHHVTWHGKLSIVRLLLQYGNTMTPKDKSLGLSISALRNDTAMAKYFLSIGADPNLWTEAPIALRSAFVETIDLGENMVQLLIDHGADTIKYSLLAGFRGFSKRRYLCLLRHLALLTFEDVDIGVKNLTEIDQRPEMKEYYHSCQRELLMMKSAQIPYSTLTLYDLLIKKNYEIVKCFQNESIVALIRSDDVSFSFPKYSWNLRYKLTRGLERLDLMTKGRRFFNAIVSSAIPGEIVNVICELLSDEDLTNLGKIRFKARGTLEEFTMTLRTGRRKQYFPREKEDELW